MTNFNPALINAEEMYRYICQNSKEFVSFPIQFIPVIELPEWVNPEHQQEPCIILMEESSKTAICLIIHSSSMLKTIDETIWGKRENVAYQVPSLSSLLSYRICTSVSGKKLVKIYEHALLISQELHISLPVILVVDKEQIPGNTAQRFTALDENDAATGDIIEIGYAGTLDMIHALAHELRHCWQEYKSSEEYYNNYKPSGELTYEDFNSQMEEIDAEAYACNYINNLGFDGMQFTYHKDVDYDLYNAVKARIKNMKDHTSLQ